MRSKKISFGDLVRKIRKSDPRKLRQRDVADELDMNLSFYTEIECNHRRPFTPEEMKTFIEYLNVTEEEQAQLYDLASQEKREIPYDLEEIFLDDNIGALAREALRRSKEVNADEKMWRQFIWDLEDLKNQEKRGGDTNC